MQTNTIKEIIPLKKRTIILLDGREITVPLYKNFKINNHDGLSFLLHFNIFNDNNILHRALSNLVIDMLSIHSITYTATTTRALKKWFECDVCLATTLGLDCLDSLTKVNISYIPFITPLLRKLSKNFKNLVSNDLADFLENSEKWEERKPAYFKLIANDPEKGAFTLQELENIHSSLNIAFSNMELNLFDYTLAWFFLATGVRPVQISRLKNKDIDIINKDVMIKVPLAKGEGTIEQGYFLRKAPTVLAECLIEYIRTVQNSDKDSSLFDLTPNQITMKIKSIFNKLDTYSSRLESKIPVNAYRFRYTLATRALANGASDQEVARLLTHRSLACIKYYRASMP
ncbi:site-specific integrase [Acinetobacter sp. SK-43]|uniref:site-specific integrase n=2 Tax=Acinetobacter TaxID=469 RepID=UPI00188D37BE|nr:site-specific integrase [Acinetobacter sp. SK-43]MBF4455075.1 site-specific integrase [Acinetobacter sp. SK-43]